MQILLPTPNMLLRKSKSLAALDSIVCQDWEFRYFSHNSKWGVRQEMGSMRNGEGDDYFLFFSDFGVAIKGCFLDGGYSGNLNLISKIKKELPGVFEEFLNEPAFSIDESSFVIWFDEGEGQWIKVGLDGANGPSLDGSDYLMKWLIEGADFYKEWADDYYDESISIPLVQHIFDCLPIDEQLMKEFFPNIDREIFYADMKEIGYPCNFPL